MIVRRGGGEIIVRSGEGMVRVGNSEESQKSLGVRIGIKEVCRQIIVRRGMWAGISDIDD